MPSNAEFVEDASASVGGQALVMTQFTEADNAPKGVASVSARAIVVIPDDAAPSAYGFDLSLPDEVTARARPDGGFDLVEAASAEAQTVGTDVEVLVGQIEPAWAVDANGISVATSYSYDGTTLTQVIDLDAVTAFPVVADPEVKWMGYFLRLTYSKAETKGMRDQGVIIAGVVGLGAAIAAAAGPAAPAIVAGVYAASAAATGIIAATASMLSVTGNACSSISLP